MNEKINIKIIIFYLKNLNQFYFGIKYLNLQILALMYLKVQSLGHLISSHKLIICFLFRLNLKSNYLCTKMKKAIYFGEKPENDKKINYFWQLCTLKRKWAKKVNELELITYPII